MSRLRLFPESDASRIELDTDDAVRIAAELERIGVRFERWQASHPLQPGASPEAVMAAYHDDIERLKAEYGFQSVDVVSIAPDHPEREALRGRFLEEHYHAEAEVRFFVAGSGLFSLHAEGKVYEILCQQDDLIHVPQGITHWFDMGPKPFFVAIRFFTRPDGWIGHFTGNDIAQRFPRYEQEEA